MPEDNKTAPTPDPFTAPDAPPEDITGEQLNALIAKFNQEALTALQSGLSSLQALYAGLSTEMRGHQGLSGARSGFAVAMNALSDEMRALTVLMRKQEVSGDGK